MGLPSGVHWASCNIGAERPSDLGLYFSWGNTEGHAENSDYDFSQEVYSQTPGAAIETNLPLENDAARANLGAAWRMPSAAEFQELVDNCTIEWTTMNGVKGNRFTSNINGKTLFFPAAGNFSGTSLESRGVAGYYWSSTYVSASNAQSLRMGSTNVDPLNNGGRRRGIPVRGVIQSA